MFDNKSGKKSSAALGARMLVIHGRRFSNSAAKFWSALMDELLEEDAGCRKAVLEAVNEGNLDPVLLFPEIELEQELNRGDLSMEGVSEAWRQALADFELYGPPGAVNLRIYSASGEQWRLTLPMDCVDAEIFLYLLVWLLEWSELPLHCWNDPGIKGGFTAADPLRKFQYGLQFAIERKHLSEGLYAWQLELQFKRHDLNPDISSGLKCPPERLRRAP